MADLPDNGIGFEAVGEVDAEDYKSILDPAIDDAMKFMGWMVPGEIKVYLTSDFATAREWASE